jgi:hypothetical protein
MFLDCLVGAWSGTIERLMRTYGSTILEPGIFQSTGGNRKNPRGFGLCDILRE